jgi:hypothetical protein
MFSICYCLDLVLCLASKPWVDLGQRDCEIVLYVALALVKFYLHLLVVSCDAGKIQCSQSLSGAYSRIREVRNQGISTV